MTFPMPCIASREMPLLIKKSLSSSNSPSQARETLSAVMKMKAILCKQLTILQKLQYTDRKN